MWQRYRGIRRCQYFVPTTILIQITLAYIALMLFFVWGETTCSLAFNWRCRSPPPIAHAAGEGGRMWSGPKLWQDKVLKLSPTVWFHHVSRPQNIINKTNLPLGHAICLEACLIWPYENKTCLGRDLLFFAYKWVLNVSLSNVDPLKIHTYES